MYILHLRLVYNAQINSTIWCRGSSTCFFTSWSRTSYTTHRKSQAFQKMKIACQTTTSNVDKRLFDCFHNSYHIGQLGMEDIVGVMRCGPFIVLTFAKVTRFCNQVW